ncbi:hypothetical protein NEOLI_003209, partial [Neolecta irregularis DAH-3]
MKNYTVLERQFHLLRPRRFSANFSFANLAMQFAKTFGLLCALVAPERHQTSCQAWLLHAALQPRALAHPPAGQEQFAVVDRSTVKVMNAAPLRKQHGYARQFTATTTRHTATATASITIRHGRNAAAHAARYPGAAADVIPPSNEMPTTLAARYHSYETFDLNYPSYQSQQEFFAQADRQLPKQAAAHQPPPSRAYPPHIPVAGSRTNTATDKSTTPGFPTSTPQGRIAAHALYPQARNGVYDGRRMRQPEPVNSSVSTRPDEVTGNLQKDAPKRVVNTPGQSRPPPPPSWNSLNKNIPKNKPEGELKDASDSTTHPQNNDLLTQIPGFNHKTDLKKLISQKEPRNEVNEEDNEIPLGKFEGELKDTSDSIPNL